MEEILTYLYRVYNPDGARYAYQSGSVGVKFSGLSHEIKGFAQGLVKVVQKYKKPLTLVWATPPDEKDVLFPNSLLINDKIDDKEKPKIAKAIVKELVRALSGK